MKLLLIPAAFVVAVITAYVVCANERQNAENPLTKWFGDEDAFLTHYPHPWSTVTHYPSEGIS